MEKNEKQNDIKNYITNIINNIIISLLFYKGLKEKYSKNTFINFSIYIYNNYWVVELAKLNDPKEDNYGNKNISLNALKNEEINSIISENKILFTKIKKIRNKLLSHNDYKEITKGYKNDFNDEEIESIEKILKNIYIILNPESNYKIFIKSFSENIKKTKIKYNYNKIINYIKTYF